MSLCWELDVLQGLNNSLSVSVAAGQCPAWAAASFPTIHYKQLLPAEQYSLAPKYLF